MGLFKREKTYEDGFFTKQGRRGGAHMVKRFVMKLVGFFLATVIFGVIYSATTQTIFDAAWKGQISYVAALQQALIKSLQYGTMHWPQFVADGFLMLQQARVFTAFINYFIPLMFLYMAYFYLVSIVVDLLDGREGEVVRYWVLMILTVGAMMLVWTIMSGAMFMAGADITFNNTEIACNLNVTGETDPVVADLSNATFDAINTSHVVVGNTTMTLEDVNLTKQDVVLNRCYKTIR